MNQLTRGMSDTSFSMPNGMPQGITLTPNRMLNPGEHLKLSAMQNTDGLGFPSVPRGLGKEASAMSTTSLER